MKKHDVTITPATDKQRHIAAFFLVSLHEVFHQEPESLLGGALMLQEATGMDCSAGEAHNAIVAVIYELMPELTDDLDEA
jgi:hypothetical protein